MLSILWDPPSASSVPFNTEPTAYELHCQKQRELRELERQVSRFGADAMKVDPRLPLDNPLPTEEFERALQLRMPDQKAPKPEDNDPCRSLLKALGIKKSSSKKHSAGTENVDRKKDDGRPTDAGSERYFVSGEPAEK
jgi:hypothetical protein